MTRNLDGTKRERPEAKPQTEAQKKAAAKRGQANAGLEQKLRKIAAMRAKGVVI